MFFLFGLIGKENLKKLWQIFMSNSNMSQVKKGIVILDLDVAPYNRRLESNVHIKPTDRHQYLHKSSSHPEHKKRSITLSQPLLVSRTCSRENDEIIASK